MPKAEPFVISVSDAVLTDLRDRLARTRWLADYANADWAYGTELSYLRELVDYWRNAYDWRRHEAEMNAYSHFRTEIEGVPIHFLHERGKGPNPMPLLMTHGWPWTFWDFRKVIGPLTDPAAFGGDPRDCFDVVIPSLPGYGFSTPLTVTGINYWRTADLWVPLMRDVLGYDRFAAEGGDWGALVTQQLGHKYAGHLIGAYLHLTVPLFTFSGQPLPQDYDPDEAHWLERTQRFFSEGSGYMAIQGTRPQTLSVALNDSPAGLCAWLLEKRRAWSDCGGDVERRFSKDDLCTATTIYWATQSFGTSARYYYEARHNPWKPSHDRKPVVEAPTAVGAFPGEIATMPRKWAEEFFNLKRWTAMPSGGHFAPMEEPGLLVEDIRAFFRPLRDGG